MADIATIRSGIKTRLATISGLETYAYIPGQFGTPAAFVGGPESCRDITFRNSKKDWRIRVRVLVSRAAEQAGQDKLDDYLVPGTTSIDDAINGDRTLGGVADFCEVEDHCVGYGVYQHSGVEYWGFETLLRVVG